MLPSSKVVKITAKTAMKGRWSSGVIVASIFICTVLLQGLTTQLLYTATNLFFANLLNILFTIFITIPLFVSVLFFFKGVAFEEERDLASAFLMFSEEKRYIRTLSFSVLMFVRLFLAELVFLIPGIIARLFSQSATYEAFGALMPVWATGLSMVSVVLYVVGFFAAFAYLLKYYMAPFLFIANKDISAAEAIRLSAVISKGHRLDFCWLLLSMAGLIILSVFVMPLIFTLPFFLICYVVHCRFCVAAYNKSVTATAPAAPTFNPYF